MDKTNPNTILLNNMIDLVYPANNIHNISSSFPMLNLVKNYLNRNEKIEFKNKSQQTQLKNLIYLYLKDEIKN